jgi:hypothetical protein
MPRHRLRDAVWASLQAKMAAIPGIWKSDAKPLRLFIEAVVYVLRTAVAPREPRRRLPPCGTDGRLRRSWEDLPERCGNPNPIYRRYRRWAVPGSGTRGSRPAYPRMRWRR